MSVHQAFVVSPDPLSPIPSASPAVKIPEETEEDPDDPEPADGGSVKMEYFPD